MALMRFLVIGFVAAVLVACGGNRNSETRSEGGSSCVTPKSSSSETSLSSSSVLEGYVDPSTVVKGTMTDERDGKIYKTVKIGTQTWMAENLNYAYTGFPYSYKEKNKDTIYTSDSTSWCYKNDSLNCAKYGRLYTWAAVMDSVGTWSTNGKDCGYGMTCSPTYPVRGVCPEGWHLPSKDEWNTLFTAVGGKSTAGTMLKSAEGWKDYDGVSGNGSDSYSFSALPAGYRYDYGVFNDESYYAYFWSSTEHYGECVYLMYLFFINDNVNSDHIISKNRGLSVRCIKDDGQSSVTPQSSSSETSLSSSSSLVGRISCDVNTDEDCFKDERDGQTYRTVKIGNQVWMAENLNYAYTGDSYKLFYEYTSDSTSWCYNDSVEYCTRYGRFYTWAAAMDSVGRWSANGRGCGYGMECSPIYPVQGICPDGWHLPEETEWKMLFTTVGGQSAAGKALKSTSGWKDEGNGVDAYAFTALPAGYRNYGGNYDMEAYDAYFWSSTEDNRRHACFMHLRYRNEKLGSGGKYDGHSVRCVKDNGRSSVTPQSSSRETSLSSSSSLVGRISCDVNTDEGCFKDERDGQTYRTVKIGTQIWMAENLNYAYIGVPYKVTNKDNSYASDSTSWCYKNGSTNCAKYGRLYTWAAAMDSVGTWSTNSKGCGYGTTCSPTYPVRGICPEGWHLPDTTEWRTLFTAVGGKSTAGTMLKSAEGWKDYDGVSGNGSDSYSFSALPAGSGAFGGGYLNEGYFTYFWSSTEYNSLNAYNMSLFRSSANAILNYYYMYYGYSVRCVKD